VVEVGAGSTATEVVAIEPEPTLRAAAERAASEAPVPVSVRAGTAEALGLTDGEMDAAVASLVLCSVLDQARALAELHRVLRPNGKLRFYEHVIAHRHRCARSCSSPITADCGRRSAAAATQPRHRGGDRGRGIPRSNAATASAFERVHSSPASRTSSASPRRS
jgi:SAM-dependent methyltransferase